MMKKHTWKPSRCHHMIGGKRDEIVGRFKIELLTNALLTRRCVRINARILYDELRRRLAEAGVDDELTVGDVDEIGYILRAGGFFPELRDRHYFRK